MGRIARAMACFLLFGGAAQAEQMVDLELLLAVDASGSVSDDEFVLQMTGIADAFRDPRVQSAVAAGPEGRIAVSLMLWSDATSRKAHGPWVMLDGPAAARDFADRVEAMIPRRGAFLGRSGTGIGAALVEGVRSIDANAFVGTRRVIDVSGDGAETRLIYGEGAMLPEATRLADAREVTVNGLPILADDSSLDDYYARRVITGPDSFIVVAASFEAFADAMLIKLLREIQPAIGALERPTRFAMLRN